MSANHDWSGFDKSFAQTHAAPTIIPGKVTDNSAAVRGEASALGSAYAIPGAGPAAAVMNATAPAAKVVAPPTNVQPPATRQTTDGRTEYLDAKSGRYVQSTGPDKTSAPAATPLDKSLVQQTKQVVAKPITAPITSPTGTPATDAASLAANKAMYTPGGLTETPSSAYARTTAQNPTALAAAGTGQNVATNPGDIAKSTIAAPVVPKAPAPAQPIPVGIPGIPETQVAAAPAPAPAATPTTAPVPAPVPKITPNPQDDEKRQRMQSAYAQSRGGAM